MYDMINRYGKEVMLVEEGFGVLYWEPQAYNNWQGYGLGAWTTNGKPSAALEAFKN